MFTLRDAWPSFLRLAGYGLGFALVFSAAFGQMRYLGMNLLVSLSVSLVVGGGFRLVPARWYEPVRGLPPGKAVARLQLKWLGISGGLILSAFGVLRLWMGPGRLNIPSVVLVTLVALLMTSLALGRHTAEVLVERTRALEQAQARAGHLALEAQLQPHTLFNALNTILARVRPDPEGAEEAIRTLAHLLRRTMAALDRERWSLAEEVDLLRAYLDMERARFGDRFAFDISLHPEAEDVQVPPLLLLPLAENAFKHGFRAKVGTCHLRVEAGPRIIRVVDDGVGRVREAPEGVGLRTVRLRLEALGGKLHWPVVASGCEVLLELP